MRKLPRLYKILIPEFILALGVALAYPVLQPDADMEIFLFLFAATCFSTAVISLLLGLISILFIIFAGWQRAFFLSGIILIGISVIVFQIASIL